MRNFLIIGMMLIGMFMAGWFTINRQGDRTTIEINRSEIRDDTRKAIQRGREYLDREQQQLSGDDSQLPQQPYPQQPYPSQASSQQPYPQQSYQQQPYPQQSYQQQPYPQQSYQQQSYQSPLYPPYQGGQFADQPSLPQEQIARQPAYGNTAPYPNDPSYPPSWSGGQPYDYPSSPPPSPQQAPSQQNYPARSQSYPLPPGR